MPNFLLPTDSGSYSKVLQIKGGQALASPDDCLLAEEVAKADPGVQNLLKERGITNMADVVCDPWSG